MTKIKKSLILLMVLVMAMTVLVLPASAAAPEGNEVIPLVEYSPCPRCGSDSVPYMEQGESFNRYVSSCSNTNSGHNHYITPYSWYVNCTKCGHYLLESGERSLCTYIG